MLKGIHAVACLHWTTSYKCMHNIAYCHMMNLILCSWGLSPQQCWTVMASGMDVTRTQQNEVVSLCCLSTMTIMSVKRHSSSCMALARIDSRLSRNTIKKRGYKCGNMGTANVPHNIQCHLRPLGML